MNGQLLFHLSMVCIFNAMGGGAGNVSASAQEVLYLNMTPANKEITQELVRSIIHLFTVSKGFQASQH